MRTLLFVAVLITSILPTLGQSSSAKYQPGTIVAVERHASALGGNQGGSTQYDVSVRVGNVTYVVLYTPPNGANSVEYAVGFDVLVLVGDRTLTFPSKLTGTTEVPILRTETAPTQAGVDWSKAPSQYFRMKMQNLSESLGLSDEQQAKLRPIAEQEAAEAGQVCFTSVIPREERLERWEKIVHTSDKQMRSFLTQAQWEKLQELRKQQKEELKQVIAEADAKAKQ
jgi:hypothetical protein